MFFFLPVGGNETGVHFFLKRFFEKVGGVQVMLSLSEKGKSGGKKLSANEQLLALQDVLTLGVSELQLAAQRLGDHQITMSTGTNQEKRGAKEAYVKVKVEVATLEAEVEELKDVLQVLKASKADKEALEGGDINSILFASAGLGGGGSGGGAGQTNDKASSGEAHAQLLIQKLY